MTVAQSIFEPRRAGLRAARLRPLGAVSFVWPQCGEQVPLLWANFTQVLLGAFWAGQKNEPGLIPTVALWYLIQKEVEKQ